MYGACRILQLCHVSIQTLPRSLCLVQNYDYCYYGDTSACVGKLPVEPFQAHDENIFNESGGTLKNVAVL